MFRAYSPCGCTGGHKGIFLFSSFFWSVGFARYGTTEARVWHQSIEVPDTYKPLSIFKRSMLPGGWSVAFVLQQPLSGGLNVLGTGHSTCHTWRSNLEPQWKTSLCKKKSENAFMNRYKTTFKVCYVKRASVEHCIWNMGNRDKRKKNTDCLYMNRLSLEGWKTATSITFKEG